jgi:hypothetical protein
VIESRTKVDNAGNRQSHIYALVDSYPSTSSSKPEQARLSPIIQQVPSFSNTSYLFWRSILDLVSPFFGAIRPLLTINTLIPASIAEKSSRQIHLQQALR